MTHDPSPAQDGRTVRGRDGPRTPSTGGHQSLTGLRPWEVADAVWVASEHAWLTGVPERSVGVDESEDQTDRQDGRPAAPAPDSAMPAPAPAPAPAAGPDTTPRTDEYQGTPGDAGDVVSEPNGVASHGDATLSEPAAEPRRRLFRVPGPVSAPRSVSLTTWRPTSARAVGRALRAFRTAVASAYASELNEEATAERIALASSLPPVLRPTAERRWRAVLLVDNAPHMAPWREATAHFAKIAHRFGGFRDVIELSLDATSAERATLSPPGRPPGARTTSPRSLLDPTGRSVVFVLTDGSAPAWRSGAAQRLLALWGKRQPVTVLHMLPQRLWHRTGLNPSWVRLRASGPWAADRRPSWEPAEALSEVLRSRSGRGTVVPVPVLAPHPDWLTPWARFVGADEPRDVELAAVLTTVHQPPPSPSPTPSSPDPAEQVAAFRGWASTEAFQLATHMAAIQLDLPTMAEVQRRTMPHSDTEHMAEFLLSGLVSPLLWYDDDQLSFVFAPGVREELLAYGSRNATEHVIEQAAELLAPRSAAARDLLSYLRGQEASAAPAGSQDREFREVERAVLHALSGPHRPRARELDALDEVRGPFGGRSKGRGVPAAVVDSDQPRVAEPAEPSFSGVPQSSRDGFPLGTQALDGTADADPGEGESSVSTVPAASERGHEQHLTAGGPRPTRPTVWGNMPPRNLVFTGRDELLVALAHGLRSGPTAVLPHALHGMGGVGKSQLALEFVYRHASQYDLVWWIPAERPTQIQQAFVELARRMHLPVSSEAITAVPAVLEALRTGIPYGNWLLVFDNAESPNAVQEYFPSAPEGGPTGSVIVTSRNPQWNTLAHPLEVDVFDRSESIQLLRRRNPDLTDQEADMLAEVLGDLPLAVEQASAWRAETGMPPAEYLRVFEEKRAELMAVSPPTQYEETVATAWNVSLDHVETKNPGALQLLQLCSYFAPEPISRQFFSNAVADPIAPELDIIFTDPIRLSRAIREINRYSLAKIDHRTNSIQMHRLVQAVLKARMTEEQRERFQHGAHLLLAANAPSDPQDPRSWVRFGELYSHVIVSEAMESPHRHVRQLVYNVAEYLFYWGDHAAALDFASQVYSTWRERFGEGDPQTLVLGRHLRFVMWRMGRYSAAAELGERMLATLEAAGPELEEEYLRVKGQVSSDRRVRGDFRGALEFDEDVYTRAVRAFGDDDPDTLMHAFNLSVCLRVNGDFRRALDLDQAVWRHRVQMFGTDSPITLSSEASVALDRQELGEYTQALGMCEEGVEKSQEVYGDSHPMTYRAIARLGVAQRKAGMHAEAAENTRIALAALAERYGDKAPDVLQISLNFSIDLRQNGDLQEALKLGERTRKLYAETLGADHPHTISADVDLAVTLRLLDQVDAARKLNESALARFKEHLGETHPCTLITAINLANDLFAQAEAAAARDLDEHTLGLVREHLGEAHPTALVLQANLAADLRALGQTEKAAALHSESVEAIKEKLGSAHPAHQDALAWRRANCDIDPMHL
ncbi:FxSxx-COOH system tetratricopeptide repeat protein [Streptomyces sp. NBC_00878]|uniref:FxSxx-COOH system tetratricopeptide repeat protein n=1 Tax=Streptomyces sp. NBC_00878 TaxID=2975854 RepID=UPI00225279F0|nr:FxSxx-COOH system tetratricopeptide repeat protein [Streptomyces sp. NBC_00878]MCX4908781.1 FxSxx-COOH system tetratricopeptide repeat protein [Streptomyces sp. NBC_00878]